MQVTSFSCHPSSPFFVIPVSRTGMTPYLTVMPPRTVIPRFIRGISSANKRSRCRMTVVV
ncbi:hypothetical protein OZD70_02325 [Wolbachia endosymbiont of Drosophila tsacasi]|nr:hypothetical protein [Wolbachia endosymbiont of Drosophila tsacasi]